MQTAVADAALPRPGHRTDLPGFEGEHLFGYSAGVESHQIEQLRRTGGRASWHSAANRQWRFWTSWPRCDGGHDRLCTELRRLARRRAVVGSVDPPSKHVGAPERAPARTAGHEQAVHRPARR